jgi:hypothetical protein
VSSRFSFFSLGLYFGLQLLDHSLQHSGAKQMKQKLDHELCSKLGTMQVPNKFVDWKVGTVC